MQLQDDIYTGGGVQTHTLAFIGKKDRQQVKYNEIKK